MIMLYGVADWQTVKDKIFQSFKIKIENKEFGIDSFELCPKILQKALDIEQISDEEIFWILDDLHEITGEICFITQICYNEGFGPFLLKAERLGELIENYYRIFSEHFYDKNVIIISFSQKVVWLVNCLGFVEIKKM